MNIRLKDLFKGSTIEVVGQGEYKNTGNKYIEVTINGKSLPDRLNAFKRENGYSDFQRDRIVVASDGYMKDGCVQIYGIKFALEVRTSKANEKYLAILHNNKKVGYYIDYKQRATFNNVCL